MPHCSPVLSADPHAPESLESSRSAAGLGDLRADLDKLAERLDELSAGFLELRAMLRANTAPRKVNRRRRRRAPGLGVFSARQSTLAPAGPSRG